MKILKKLMMVLAVVLIVCGVLCALVLGPGYSPIDTYSSLELEDSITSDSGEISLVIETDSIDIFLYSSDSDTLSLAVTGALTDKRISVTRLGNTVRIKEQPLGLLRRLAASKSPELIVWLPKEWAGTAEITTDTGEVDMNGVAAPESTVSVSTSSAFIGAYSLQLKNLSLYAPSGDISLNDFSGASLSAETTSGYLYAGEINADGVSASATTGAVLINDTVLSGTLSLHAASSEIILEDVTAAGVTANTTDGNLVLNDVDTQSLSFTSSSGALTGRLLNLEDFAVSLSETSGTVSGVSERSEGSRTLSVVTASGDIQLED